MKLIPFLLLLVLLLSLWLLPSATPVLGISLIVISLSIAIFSFFKKHRTAYLQGRLTRLGFARNVFLDVFGILLAMTIAALLGKYLAELVAQQIDSALLRLVTGMLVGVVIGIGVGLFVRQLWGRFVKTSPKTGM